MAGTPVYGTGGFLANDLGADWQFQSSDGATSQQVADAVNGQGDVFLQTEFDAHATGSETYLFDGTVGSYNGTAGALAAVVPGNYLATAGVAIVGIDIDYSPCAAGERESVKFSYSTGLAADSAIFAPSVALPTKRENLGVPELGTNGNADSKVQTASYSVKCSEGRSLNATGTRFAGSTYGGTEEISETHIGLPAMTFATGFKVTSKAEATGQGAKSNTGYDTHSVSATRGFVRA
jgi:hypothetical protein